MTPVQTDLQREVATLLVEALNLEIAPESIDPPTPLYGEGLGLDSIDILEVALVVSERYGFQLRADDGDNVQGAFLNEYALGKGADVFPEGAGRLIKVGTKINFNLHLHSIGQSRIGSACCFAQ